MRGLGRPVRINQLDLIRQRSAGADDWCRAGTYHEKLRWEVVPHTPDTASAGWKEGVEVEILVAGSRGRGEGFDGSLWDGDESCVLYLPLITFQW